MVDSTSIQIRRRVGPTAWAVFEELALTSTGPSTSCTASVTVRSLATRLGLSKNTVAHAVSRLRAAGLVSAHHTRGATGTFATGSYRLHLPASVDIDDATTVSTTPPRARRRAPANASTTQLTLALEP